MLEKVLSYILDEALVARALLVLGLAGPPVGAALGWLAGKIKGDVRGHLVDGTLLGLFGTLTLVMWHVYNAIVERLGLDTVKNLLVNLALFTAVGLVLGLVLRRVRPALKGEAAGAPGTDPVGSGPSTGTAA